MPYASLSWSLDRNTLRAFSLSAVPTRMREAEARRELTCAAVAAVVAECASP